MQPLTGKIALVTGGSRGVGRGIAVGLGEAGATVYVTGRSVDAGRVDEGISGTLAETVAMVEAAGGRAVALPCDHRDDDQVAAVFARIRGDHGRLDVLVNNAWGGYEYIDGDPTDGFTWLKPLWEQPIWRWDAMFDAGVRAAFVASAHAARAMVAQGDGLIVSISYWAAQTYNSNAIYGAAKIAVDKMMADLARELRPHGVAALALYPGLVRTERVLRNAQYFDMSNAESPEFTGRAVAALAADPQVMARSGTVQIAAQLGLDYGFTDIDGRQPRPQTLDEVRAPE